MMVGHSQGGMQAIKVLHDLAGTFAPRSRSGTRSRAAEPRTSIVDPITGRDLPVVATKVSYTSRGAGGPSACCRTVGVITRIREIRTRRSSSTASSSASTGSRYLQRGRRATLRQRERQGRGPQRRAAAGYLHVSVPTTHTYGKR